MKIRVGVQVMGSSVAGEGGKVRGEISRPLEVASLRGMISYLFMVSRSNEIIWHTD